MRVALLAVLLLAGCDSAATPPEYQRESRAWKLIPMADGPSVYTACVGPDRIYALQPLASRATSGLWPGASIAVAKGGC